MEISQFSHPFNEFNEGGMTSQFMLLYIYIIIQKRACTVDICACTVDIYIYIYLIVPIQVSFSEETNNSKVERISLLINSCLLYRQDAINTERASALRACVYVLLKNARKWSSIYKLSPRQPHYPQQTHNSDRKRACTADICAQMKLSLLTFTPTTPFPRTDRQTATKSAPVPLTYAPVLLTYARKWSSIYSVSTPTTPLPRTDRQTATKSAPVPLTHAPVLLTYVRKWSSIYSVSTPTTPLPRSRPRQKARCRYGGRTYPFAKHLTVNPPFQAVYYGNYQMTHQLWRWPSVVYPPFTGFQVSWVKADICCQIAYHFVSCRCSFSLRLVGRHARAERVWFWSS